MFSTEESFIREIAENPTDDIPRLVFADWLEEHGDERGEFIRVQCQLAKLDEFDPQRYDLESRELQLIRQRSKGWARPFRGLAKSWTYRRGLVDGIRIDTQTFLNHKDELFANAPIQSVDFVRPVDHLEPLSHCPNLSRLSGIGFTGALIGRAGSIEHIPYAGCNSRDEYRQRVAEISAVNCQPFSQFLKTARLSSLSSLRLDLSLIHI